MIASNVTFSIVIATYNRAEFLKKCLSSLLAQTDRDFEVLVCDDGSTDNTREIVDQYTDRLDLKYFLLERSGAPAGPRNHGIRQAQGEWICFLDSDDSWTPNKLREARQYLGDFDVIYHQLTRVDDKKETGMIGGATSSWEDILTLGNPIPTSSAVVRKSYLDKIGLFNVSLKSVEDGDLWIRMFQAGARFVYIPKKLGFYYWKPGHNLASANESSLHWNSQVLDMYEKRFSSSRVRDSAHASLDFRRAQVYFTERRWRQLAKIPISSAWRVPRYSRKLKLLVALVIGKTLKPIATP